MPIDVVFGLQRGDEGKGRFVDELAQSHDIVARYNGGDNAGHTVVLPEGTELKLNLLPSGIAHKGLVNVIGNGTVINPIRLRDEIGEVENLGIEVTQDNLLVSQQAHLITPIHIFLDTVREESAGAQGSTKRGIAPVMASKMMRDGIRLGDVLRDPSGVEFLIYEGLLAAREARRELNASLGSEEKISDRSDLAIAARFVESAQAVGKYATDTVEFLNTELRRERPKKVLAEGAQAFLLDIDHGMYPYVTSSSTTTGAVSCGLGVAPHFIDKVYGIAKLTPSHVGGGPFVTEIKDPELADRLRGNQADIDSEYGTTTGRPRRIGFFDLPQIRRALLVNGDQDHTFMGLTKLDRVPEYGDEITICTEYERNGEVTEQAPDSACALKEVKPVYTSLPNWSPDLDISSARSFQDLPPEAQHLVRFIEDRTGVKVSMLGVGPRRDQVINL
jgi:adenylosuccinate synthase